MTNIYMDQSNRTVLVNNVQCKPNPPFSDASTEKKFCDSIKLIYVHNLVTDGSPAVKIGVVGFVNPLVEVKSFIVHELSISII